MDAGTILSPRRARWLAVAAPVLFALLAGSLRGTAAPAVDASAPAQEPTACPRRALEVYFLVDDSNCFLNAWMNEMPAREAIAQGIDKVLGKLDLTGDRAAVLGFGDTARTYQPMTGDRDAILAAARAVSMQDNSARLDLGFLAVTKELETARHQPDAQVVTVTVTDGPMNAPLRLTEERAKALRRNGARHYAIGIGDLAQFATLRTISEPDGLIELDFGGDLITAYATLGDQIAAVAASCLPATPTPGPAPTEAPTPTPKASSPPPSPAFLPLVDR